VQKPDGVLFAVIGAKRVGANQFRQISADMGRGLALRAHFIKNDPGARLGGLPGGFRAGKAGADYVDGFVFAHGRAIISRRSVGQQYSKKNKTPAFSL